MCTLIVPWSLQDSGNLAAVLYRTVSPTTTIPPLGMTGPTEHMEPVGICPHQLLAKDELLFGTIYLRKVCIPCGPTMMELLKNCWKTAGYPWGGYLVIFWQKYQISGISSSKLTLCRTGNITKSVFYPKPPQQIHRRFPQVSGYYIIDKQHHVGHTVL